MAKQDIATPATGEDELPYLVPGLVRGIRILQLFKTGRETIAPPEMARELKLPRTTVYRLVQSLEHLGMLQRVDGGSAFRPGLAILSLGFECLASMDFSELGRPILDRLSARTGLTAHLVLRDGRDVVVVLKSQGRSPFASALQIGARLPTHGTVLGRMTLIDLDHRALAQIFEGDELPAFTAQTPRTLEALEAMLAMDRKRGYALSDGFFERGISSVAAPVRDRNAVAVGAVNVTLNGAPGQGKEFEETIAAVVEAGQQLSTTLRHHPMPVGELLSHAV